MWIAVGAAVGSTVLTVVLVSVCVAGGAYCVYRSKRSNRNKSLQNSGRSLQKYSEAPDQVRLLQVSETKLLRSPKPPRQRISVSLSSLAQYQSEVDFYSDRHKSIPSRSPQPRRDSSSPGPKPSISSHSPSTVIPPLHLCTSSSPQWHSETHSRCSSDAVNPRGTLPRNCHSPPYRQCSPSSSTSFHVSPPPGPRVSSVHQRLASGYGEGGVYNTQLEPRSPKSPTSYPQTHRGSNTTSRTSGSSWTTSIPANGSAVLFAYGRPMAELSHGSLLSLPDHRDNSS